MSSSGEDSESSPTFEVLTSNTCPNDIQPQNIPVQVQTITIEELRAIIEQQRQHNSTQQMQGVTGQSVIELVQDSQLQQQQPIHQASTSTQYDREAEQRPSTSAHNKSANPVGRTKRRITMVSLPEQPYTDDDEDADWSPPRKKERKLTKRAKKSRKQNKRNTSRSRSRSTEPRSSDSKDEGSDSSDSSANSDSAETSQSDSESEDEIHSSITAQLTSRAVKKAKKGEYVDLDNVFDKSTKQDKKAVALVSAVTGKSTVQNTMSFDMWLERFLPVAAVEVDERPETAVGVITYIAEIHAAATHCRLKKLKPAWIKYDKQFRKDLARSKKREWGKFDSHLHSKTIAIADAQTFRPSQPTFNLFRGEHNQGPARQQKTCNLFNFDRNGCRFGFKCMYQHICSSCYGPHSSRKCNSKQPSRHF